MDLICIGINHRTAPIEIREKMWFSDDEVKSFLPLMKEQYAKECVLLSTCNRTELYYIPRENPSSNGKDVLKFLSRFKSNDESIRDENFYTINAVNVVKHLFKVTAAIDSMVLGDVQILNQVKEAFTMAFERGTTGIILNRLFNNTLHLGKRVRTETEIGEGAISVSYAAAELASKIFEDLSKRTALLIGAGETGELTAKHLRSKELGKLIITNRTRERAESLAAQLDATVVDFDSLMNVLNDVDIVISSVNTGNYLMSAKDLQRVTRTRANRPLFIIDIGVPRNIDPKANDLENVFLNDIDALNHIIDRNLANREAQLPKVQQIVMEELNGFFQWFKGLDVTPTIEQLRDQFEAIRHDEVEKFRHKFSSDKHEELEMLTRRIVNKILHTPMVNLRNGASSEDDQIEHKVHILRSLFGLDKKK
ncbi:MAG: glutamyl-tRNA reductase [Bacteroidota bacterium]